MKYAIALLVILAQISTAQDHWMYTATELTKGHRFDTDTNERFTLVDASLTNGLVLMHPFSVDDGTNTYDVSTTGNDGYVSGATWTNTTGGCLDFNGTSDYVLVDDGLAPISSDNTFTITMWVRLDSLDSPAPETGTVLYSDTVAQNFYAYVFSTGYLRLVTGADFTSDTSTLPLSTSQWYHLAFLKNGTTTTSRSIYVNGVKATMNAATTASTPSISDLHIGRYDGASYETDGLIDGFRIYDVALSTNAITDIYNAEPTQANGGKR